MPWGATARGGAGDLDGHQEIGVRRVGVLSPADYETRLRPPDHGA
jgi:hypothetical protein